MQYSTQSFILIKHFMSGENKTPEKSDVHWNWQCLNRLTLLLMFCLSLIFFNHLILDMFPDYSPVSSPKVFYSFFFFFVVHCQTSADTTWNAALFGNVFKYTKKEWKINVLVCTLTLSFQSYVNCTKKEGVIFRVTYSSVILYYYYITL